MKFNGSLFITFFLIFPFIGCDNSKAEFDKVSMIIGSGSYAYNNYEPFKDKQINAFYHVPESSNKKTPILIVLDGSGRFAESLRNDFIVETDKRGFIVLSIEFSSQYFPGSDSYNLNNMFADGDNPSAATQNEKSEWTSSAIEPLFQNFKTLIGNESEKFDLFGFSAGSQLAQRFLIFDSGASLNRVVLASAGWYNVPNDAVDFPYGLNLSPLAEVDKSALFAIETYIIVGQNDTDPNSYSLRHNSIVDKQGDTRFQRAQYFYEKSRLLALDGGYAYNWNYKSIPNTGHESAPIASFTAGFLY
jgi:hypothetical protein